MKFLAEFILAWTIGTAFLSGRVLAEPTRFNLHCEGSERLTEANIATVHDDWQDDIRVDVSRNIYCFGLCMNSYPINLNGPTTIYLEEDGEDQNAKDQEHMEFYRANMQLLWFIEHDKPSEHIWKSRFVKATCKYTPFTGIPH